MQAILLAGWTVVTTSVSAWFCYRAYRYSDLAHKFAAVSASCAEAAENYATAALEQASTAQAHAGTAQTHAATAHTTATEIREHKVFVQALDQTSKQSVCSLCNRAVVKFRVNPDGTTTCQTCQNRVV